MNTKHIIALQGTILFSLFFASCEEKNKTGSTSEPDLHGDTLAERKNETGTIPDLIEYFESKGLNGRFSPKEFGMIGAIDGGSYSNSKELRIEIYKFETPNKAASLKELMGGKKLKIVTNGSFAIFIHSGGQEVIDAFNNF